METNNEQIKLLFEKNKNNIDKYFLFKLISNILLIVLIFGIVFLPCIKMGDSFDAFSEKYSIELTSKQQSELKSLFKEQEKNYKKELDEIKDEYGEDLSDLLGVDLAFDDLQIVFWLQVENLIGKSLSSTQRKELVALYKSSSTIYSAYDIFTTEWEFEIVGEEVPDFNVILGVCEILAAVFFGVVIFYVGKEIYGYVKRNYGSDFEFFINRYDNHDESKKFFRKNQIMACFVGGMLYIILDVFFVKLLTSTALGLSATIIFLIAGLVAFFVLLYKANTYLKNIKESILREKYKIENLNA